MHLYTYFMDYTQNVNSKIEHISKMVVTQSHNIKEKDDKIFQLQQNITLLTTKVNELQENLVSTKELANKYDGIQKNIEVIKKFIKKDLNDTSENIHTSETENIHINISKLFQFCNDLSFKYHAIQKNIEVVKKDLNNISEHSHINMDKIFELSNKYDGIKKNMITLKNKYDTMSYNNKYMDLEDVKSCLYELCVLE